jgi:V8-like Glu-specific endopeptidase
VRLDELRAPTPVLGAEASVPPDQQGDAGGWKNFSADGQEEVVIVAGQPSFVDVAFLAIGVLRASSVCRLVMSFPTGKGSGTAFRVGNRHLLTNHHVVRDHQRGDVAATSVEAWFNYEDDTAGEPKQILQIACDASGIVGEKEDDWALVPTTDPIPDEFPVLALETTEIPGVDDRVYIIQHPGGGPKQVAFQHNLVRAVTEDVLQYWTDTDLGSSGSPVFDEHWRVVALHHFSVKIAADRMGVRNQGRRIDRVVERIRARNALPELAP